ncbi:Selenium-binding protein 2 [Camellia lanceoleosa]|uniref:Selenium-binding protein 2 n=1 Tax=Camellia lanceoleosa TaxID=1840588 RepID=A0ACC0FJS8_9ERIC|nr:Selenium-binding protein 2 [Camellia lanceoleosa]
MSLFIGFSLLTFVGCWMILCKGGNEFKKLKGVAAVDDDDEFIRIALFANRLAMVVMEHGSIAEKLMVVMEHGSIAEKEVKNNHGCCKGGPWCSSPLAAMSGPRESLIYVTCVYTGSWLVEVKDMFGLLVF